MIKQLLMNSDNELSTNRFVLIVSFIVSSFVVIYTTIAHPEHLTGVLGFYLTISGALTVTKGVKDHADAKLSKEHEED